MKSPVFRMVAAMGAAFLVAACASSSIHLVKTRKSPEAMHKTYRKILVVGASENLERRQLFEDIFVKEFEQLGVAAVQSYLVVHTGDALSREHLKEAARISRSDGVLITRLVDIRKEVKVEPGSETVGFKPVTAYPVVTNEDDMPPKPEGYYGEHPIPEWETPYGETIIREPPAVITELKVSIETRLFDAAAANMVWVGDTESGVVKDLKKSTKTFAGEIIRALAKDGMI